MQLMRNNNKTIAFSDQVAGFTDKFGLQLSKYFFFIVSCSLLTIHCAMAQVTPSQDLPWIMVQKAKLATTNEADLSNPAKAHIQINYFDGAGRGFQNVTHKASPLGFDVISGVQTLDEYGRTDRAYLPVASASSSGQYITNTDTRAQAFYGDTKPYSKVAQYETSPLSRTLKTFQPGAAFQTFSALGVQQDFTVAGAGIRRYTLSDDNTATISGTYTDGQLIRTVTRDEDNNEVIEYRGSKSGRVIQQHRKDRNLGTLLITAYVYNYIGRLRFVILPKLYNVGGTVSVSSHAEGMHIYRYDDQGRNIEVQKPGAGPEYTVFNELGQTVLFQDARQRESGIWTWIKRDGHGRTVMDGTLSTTYTRSQLQGFFDGFTAPEQFEEPSTAGGNLLRYTNRSFPSQIALAESNVLTVNYYDQYHWVNDAALDFQYYQTPRYSNAKGLPTGNMTRRLDTGMWMKTVVYYDDQNRVIQSQTRNRYGTVNRTDVVQDFEGKVSENRTIYRRPGHADLTVSTHYTYDASGRQLSATHKTNGIETPLAKYEYDEIGRVKRKHLGVAEGVDHIIESTPQPSGNRDIAFKSVTLLPGAYTAENGTYLAAISPGIIQSIDYSYTINGQLRGINLNAAGNIDLSGGKIFGLKLDHHETGAMYNGKLHKQTWATRTPGSATLTQRSFTYGYNGYDWVSSATYTGPSSGSGVGEDYGMPGIDYDANGNLTAFNRRGLASPGNWQSIDALEFGYTHTVGNKLQYIKDWANKDVGFKEIDFNLTNDYSYWSDGSLKSDANKGITLIEYNHLGLEKTVHWGGSKRIENIYDAEGVKLEQRLINGSSTHTTEYVGELIYVNGALQTIMHEEGRVKVEGINNRYQFFTNDFRGDTRIIIERVNDTTALVQENHFGVFGEPLHGIGQEGDWKRLYQGKEYTDFEGYNTYDFHARQYDPWTGRFNAIDPVDAYGFSGYSGMNNNPLSYIDPDGRSPLLLAIGIGALIGGHINGSIKGYKGGNYFDGFWRGAITGAAGGALGFYAPIGIGSGLAYGAGSGAITGGIGAGLNGGNIGQGMLYGGISGGIFGGISGGIGAKRLGANIWSGQSPPLDLGVNEINSVAGNEVSYNHKSLLAFRKKQFPSEGNFVFHELSPPDGYLPQSDGTWLNTTSNQKVLGVTKRSVWFGGRSAKVHLSPKSFSTEQNLFLVMGHEYTHAQHIIDGLVWKNSGTSVNGHNINPSEKAAILWEQAASRLNGWHGKYNQYFQRQDFLNIDLTPKFYSRVNTLFKW